MLSSFLDWARHAKASQGANGVCVYLTESLGSDNPSARLDIDTAVAVARITCWESGDYDTEVIDLETERTLYSSRGTFQGRIVTEQFVPFFEALGLPVT